MVLLQKIEIPPVCRASHVNISCGTDISQIFRMHWHDFVEISGVKRWPFETTRFSRQFKPERASC